MIIQLTGVPGAGKSSLWPALQQCLAGLGIEALSKYGGPGVLLSQSRMGRFLSKCLPLRRREQCLRGLARRWVIACGWWFALKHIRMTLLVLAALRRLELPLRQQMRVMNLYLSDGGQQLFARRHLRRGQALILPEGLVQRVSGIFASAEKAAEGGAVSRFAALLPHSELVIRVQADLHKCVRRVAARPQEHRVGEANLLPYLQHAATAIDLLLRKLSGRGWAIIEVTNNGTLKAAESELCRKVQQYLHTVGSPAPADDGIERKPLPNLRGNTNMSNI